MQLPGLPAELWPPLLRAAAGARLALVGGAVRDLLLHRNHRDPWRGLMDLDLVVEAPTASASGTASRTPPAQVFLRAMARQSDLQLLSSQEHGAYGTVELELRCAGVELLLDLASARREVYLQAAGRPVVSFARLEDDLARRDFSINAMALVLDGESPQPQLLDPHGGQRDLQRRQLRLLHPDSLRDDPTRLVRAARYAARLGFQLEPESLAQVNRTLEQWPWDWRWGDPPAAAPVGLGTRLRMELELLLDKEPWLQALAALQAWGGVVLLDPELQRDQQWHRRLHWASRFGLPRLPALLAVASDPIAAARRLQLPEGQLRLLEQGLELRRRLVQLEPAGAGRGRWPAWSPSRWTAFLEVPGCSAEAVALALACTWGPRRPLLAWWCRWRHLRAPLSAKDLMAREGLAPGPALGARLRQLRAVALDQGMASA